MSKPGIGVHLPHGVPGIDGDTILAWAKSAENAGFSSIGVAERFTYATADAMVTLAAAAAVTTRIRLLANIFIASLRAPAVFAKEVATLSLFAPGRLTIGVAGGARPQDYNAVDVPWNKRGRRVDASLAALQALATPIDYPHSLGPVPAAGIEVLVGGASKGAIQRMLRYGNGYIGGGVKPEFVGYEVMAIKAAWTAAGKSGQPRIVAGAWFASDARYDEAEGWLNTYLLQGGPPDFVRAPIARGRHEVIDMIEGYTAAGATEVVLFSGVSDPAELDWLADAVSDYLG